MKKLTATILTLTLLTQVAAKTKGDWNAVKGLMNSSVAVQTKSGETHYGLMQLADDTHIEIKIAGDEDFTPQELVVQRNEVQKVWRAKLRFGERNIAKGGWIGLGVGFGAALITAGVLAAKNSDDPPVGLGTFPLYGAGAGALAGAFWKKKHKKQDLVYSL